MSVRIPDREPIEAYLQDVGDQVRALREHRRLGQAALARRAGISVRCLRDLEAGKNAGLRTVARVAKALDCYPEDLKAPAGLSGGVARAVLQHMDKTRTRT